MIDLAFGPWSGESIDLLLFVHRLSAREITRYDIFAWIKLNLLKNNEQIETVQVANGTTIYRKNVCTMDRWK